MQTLLANAETLKKLERDGLLSLFDYFDEIFTDQPGCTSWVQYGRDTDDALPWKCNPKPLSAAKWRAIDEALQALLDAGLICRSSSPWGFPVVLVPKKDRTWRLCVDYRRLNAVTKKDAYPFPRIDEIVLNLDGAKYFSNLDASKGYLEAEMRPGEECKTVFTCHRGPFHFKNMPFGLSGAPSPFQRLMDRVLDDVR